VIKTSTIFKITGISSIAISKGYKDANQGVNQFYMLKLNIAYMRALEQVNLIASKELIG
jgi:hypothetical protein